MTEPFRCPPYCVECPVIDGIGTNAIVRDDEGRFLCRDHYPPPSHRQGRFGEVRTDPASRPEWHVVCPTCDADFGDSCTSIRKPFDVLQNFHPARSAKAKEIRPHVQERVRQIHAEGRVPRS